MLTRLEIVRGLKKLHHIRSKDPVPEELRGWSYHTPPVKPRAYLGLGVGEVAYRYCETRRDLYLRRVVGARGDSSKPALANGASIHRIFSEASKAVRALALLGRDGPEIYEELSRKAGETASKICPEDSRQQCEKLYRYLALMWSAEVSKAKITYGSQDAAGLIPWISELRVDGTLVGLSDRLSIDALAEPSIVIEIKTGQRRNFHRLALAGYALAIESSLEIPVDYGALIYININGEIDISIETHYISPDLRKEFIDARDEAIDLILSGKDPGIARNCPETCPFLEICGVRR
ncbi:MAG: type I-A CRISPR-associated protein Cas4/Csa1 [Sulfolobales archaeon]